MNITRLSIIDYGHICKNDSICTFANQDGSIINCSCAYNFGGKYCDEPLVQNVCEPNPCNNGTCIELELGYRCECPKG